MQQNTKWRWLHKSFVFLLSILVALSCMLPGSLGAQNAYAAEGDNLPSGGIMTLTGEDDNGAVGADQQTINITNTGKDTTAKTYEFKVTLDNLPAVSGRKVKIEVAPEISLKNNGTNDSYLKRALVNGDLSSRVLETRTIPVTRFLNGSYSDHELGPVSKSVEVELDRNAGGCTWLFVVSPQTFVNDAEIADAIKVTYTEPGKTPVVLTKKAIQDTSMWDWSDYTTETLITKPLKSGESTKMWSPLGTANIRTQGWGSAYTPVSFSVTLPEGVNVSLGTDMQSYFTLEGSGNQFTASSKGRIYCPYGDSADPMTYTVNYPEGKKELEVKGVKTLYALDGTVADTREYKWTFKKVEKDSYLPYTQYVSTNQAAANDTAPAATTVASTAYLAKNGWYSNRLGVVRFGNWGTLETPSMTAQVLIDDSKVRALAVPLPINPGVTSGKVWMRTNVRGWFETNVKISEPSPNFPGSAQVDCFYITPQHAGSTLPYGEEWITGLRYEVGSIPADTHLGTETEGHSIIGYSMIDPVPRTDTKTRVDVGTVELYETENPGNSTGKGNIRFWPLNSLPTQLSGGSTVAAEAGKKTTIAGQFLPGAADAQAAPKALYIVVPKGATVTGVRLRSGDTNTVGNINLDSYLNAADWGNNKKFTADGKEYYRISLEDLPLPWALAGTRAPLADGSITYYRLLTYYADISLPKSTEPGIYPFRDMVFAEMDVPADVPVTAGQAGLAGTDEGFESDNLFLRQSSANYLRVDSLPDITAVASSKTAEMADSGYRIYDPSDQQSALPIGVAATDAVNMKVNVTNSSGVDAPSGTKIWFPIPKKGEDWGALSEDSRRADGTITSKLPYGLNLLEKLDLTNIDTSRWYVEYGINVTPPASGEYTQNWDAGNGTWTDNPTSSQFRNVNCLRFTAIDKIPGKSAENENEPYQVDFVANVAIDPDDKDQKGTIDVIRPIVYRDFTTSDGRICKGPEIGDPTGMTIAQGKIQGDVFYDEDGNGLKGVSESAIAGGEASHGDFTVELYGGRGTDKVLLKTTTVDASGHYQFTGLATGDEYKGYYAVKILNKDGVGKDFRKVGATTSPTENDMIISNVKNTNGKSAGNAFTHTTDGSNAADKYQGYAYATVEPVDKNDFTYTTEDGGWYNLGVHYGNRRTTVTFKSDTSKGSLKDRDEHSTIEKGENDDRQMSFTGAASDLLTWPSVEAKKGYAFIGWKYPKDGTSPLLPQPTSDVRIGSENMVYEAQFKALPYTLSFDSAGGTPEEISSISILYGEIIKEQAGFPENPYKEGYLFRGWKITRASDPLVTGNILGDNDKMPAGEVDLQADYEARKYKVNYEMNGAADIDPKTVKYTDGSLAPAKPTWEGHSFEGWFVDEKFKTKYENQTYKQIAKADSVEEITLYAKWSTNSYKVSFNTAGADSSTPDPINVTYGTTIVSHPDFPDDPVRRGYSFDGWYTKDITGSEAKLKNSDLMPAKAVTLTAKWTEKSYTVKYNTDGGSEVDDMTGVKWSQTGLIPSTAPKKTGNTFDGWYTASGAKYVNQAYSAIAANDSQESITLTARWSDTQYTVKYDTDGGTKIDDRKNVNWNDGNLAPLNEPKKDGYTIEGWYTNAQKTTAYNNQRYSQLAANDSQESITLYVKWEPTADMRAAMAVKDLIDALPPEDQITPEDGEQIRGAEKAYKDLNSEQQRLLDVLDSTSKPTLDNALAKLKEVEDRAAADAVTDKINALPAKEEVKLEDEAAITDARKAYEALTEDQKKLITEETLAKLTAAEEGLAAAKDAAALAKAKNDAKAELDKVDVSIYEEPELSVVKKAIEDGKKEIDASTTIPQVDAAKKKALDTIAAQKTAAQKAEEQKKQDEDPKNIPAEVTDKTPANLVAVTTAITTAKNDGDLKGSTYAPLKFMSKKQTKKSIKLQWSKVKGAKQYTVYANQCGTKNKYKKLATVKGKTLNVKKVAGKKLKKGTYYKFLLIAENGNKVNAISKTLHVRTAGHKKYTNYKSVTVSKKVIKNAKKLKKGKKLSLKAKAVAPKGKKVVKHVNVRYETANKKIATVSAKGVVKGVKKGKTKIYCYAQNGIAKVVTVTVK